MRAREDDAVLGETTITSVGGESGTLAYRGFDISELLPRASFESLVSLLVYGDPPLEDPPAELVGTLTRLRPVPESLATLVHGVERSTPAIDDLRTAVSALGSGRFGSPPTEAEGVELIARSPSLLASLVRGAGALAPVPPRDDLGHVANYLWMLTGKESDPKRVRALEQYFLLLADHGMNASTLALRVVISTGADLGAAATAALGALKGPAHGGATSLVSEMLDEAAAAGSLERWVRNRLDRHERLPGFGHRVYAAEDPRARALHGIAGRVAAPERLRLAESVEAASLEALRAAKPALPLYTNVEFYAAVVLEAVGIPRALFTPTFALARTAGWAAHALEQSRTGRMISARLRYAGAPSGRIWPAAPRRA